VAIVDCAICGAFTIACGLLTPSVPLAWTLFVVLIYGITRSMQFSTMATLAYADVPSSQMSAANTLWNAAAQTGTGLGIAFGALALRAASAINGEGGGHAFTLDDFRLAFLSAGLLTLVSIVGYVRLANDAGHKLRARH
jgi:hypothetical protein